MLDPTSALAATNLPDNGGYVAAAYLVLLGLVLVYLLIMTYKLNRLSRRADELAELVERTADAPQRQEHEKTPA